MARGLSHWLCVTQILTWDREYRRYPLRWLTVSNLQSNPSDQASSNGSIAVQYVEELCWYIFPVWGIDEISLACMCGNPECRNKGKHPLASLAPNGHNSASNDPEQIKQWWSIAPNANIGVDCGRSGLIVLDCDGDDGAINLLNWCSGFGLNDLPTTLQMRTGGGGEHYFYAAGNHIVKSMNGYLEHNDVKAQGGYVILPPSLHRSGNRYQVMGEFIRPVPIPDLLASHLASSKSGAVYEKNRRPGSPSFTFSEARKYGAKAGYRDEFFNSLAFQLKKNGASEPEAYEEVKRVWELTEQPVGDEFSLQEALTKLIRVYNDPSVEPDVMPDWPNGMRGESPRKPGNANRLKFNSVRAIRSNRTNPEWLVKNCWLNDGFGMIGGGEKTLKSWTLLNFAIAVASGRPLFMNDTFQVVTRGPVVVLTAEGGEGLYLDRLDHLCKMYEIGTGGLDDEIFVTSDVAPIDSLNFVDGLADIIQERQPALIQLDPLLFYMGADIDAGNVFSTGPALAALRDAATGRAMQICHHFNKSGARELSLSSLTQSGSREIIDHWLLIKHGERADLAQQRFQLDALLGARRGFGWEARFDILLGAFDGDSLTHSGVPSWTVEMDRGGRASKDLIGLDSQILQMILDNPDSLKRNDVYKEFGGSGKVKPVLDFLINSGIVIEIPIKQLEGNRQVNRRCLRVVLTP